MNTPATTEKFVCSACYQAFAHATQLAPDRCPSCGSRAVGSGRNSWKLLLVFTLPFAAVVLWLLLKR